MRIAGASLIGVPLTRLAPQLESGTRVARHRAVPGSTTHETLSRRLARFVVNTQFGDLPDAIVEAWKAIVLDSLAIGFVGSTDRLARAVTDVARTLGGTGECTVINAAFR